MTTQDPPKPTDEDRAETALRLVRLVRSQAEDLREDGSDVTYHLYPAWGPTETQLALHCARVYLAGLKAAWVAGARACDRKAG